MSSRDRESRRGGRRHRSMSRSRSRSRSRSYSSRGAGGGRYRNRAEDEDGNPHFSDYYRDRFGSESPQEYQNLRVTNVDSTVTNDELRDTLEKYLGRYGELNVKVIRQMDIHQRIAYVNFERIGDARNARHGCLQRLVDLLGRRLTIDPAGVVRDQEGRCVKTTNGGGRSPPYPTQRPLSYTSRPLPYRNDRERTIDRDSGRTDDYRPRRQQYGDSSGSVRSLQQSLPRDSRHYDNRDRTSSRRTNDYATRPPSAGGGGDWMSPRAAAPPIDDQDEEANATRTLFVGNLHGDVTKADLQKTFNKYGVIEQIDIKTPHDSPISYAFVRFQNLPMAQEAKQSVAGRCGAWKIGYGKPTPSRRLWVGGLGPNTSLAWLEKEFDRFGAIEKIDYVRGENHAYVLFASDEASSEAWRKMKGMQLKDGGEKHLLQVDFADSSMYDNGDNGENHDGRRYTSSSNRPATTQSPERISSSSAADRQPHSSLSKRPGTSPTSSRRPTTPGTDRPAQSASPAPLAAKQKASSKKGVNSASSSSLRSPRTPPLPISASSNVASPPPVAVSPVVVGQNAAGVIHASGAGAVGCVISDGTVSSTTTSPPTSLCELSAHNLDELHQLRSPCWTGALVLKKSAYPIRLYKLAGDDDLIDTYLRNERGESVQLVVTQRLKLDQPKEDDVQKWLSSPSDQHAFLLAAANTNALTTQGNLADLQPRPLKLLVKYFKEKDAAGVVSVVANRRTVVQQQQQQQKLETNTQSQQQQQQNGILYTFPQCQFADLLTSTLCPKLAVMQRCTDDCLLVVLQKSSTT